MTKDFTLVACGAFHHPKLNCVMKGLSTRNYATYRARDIAETLVKAGYSNFQLFDGDQHVCEIRVTTTVKSEVFE